MPERNAAAALGNEKFNLFKKAASDFLESPSIKFFKKEIVDEKFLTKKKETNKLLLFKINAHEGKEDVVGGKLLKSYIYILNKFTNSSFTIIDSGWEWDKKEDALFWFIAKREFLERSFLSVGPPLKETYHVNLFKKKHASTIERDGRIYANVERPFRKIELLAKSLVKSDYLKDRVVSTEFKLIK
jgi:tRNA nucleotidyltransferase (CCA-adding enzyme)